METTSTITGEQADQKESGNLVPLSSLKAGEEGMVKKISGGMGFIKKLINIGIRTGSTIKVLNTSSGPIIITTEGTKAAIGRGAASKILIEKMKE